MQKIPPVIHNVESCECKVCTLTRQNNVGVNKFSYEDYVIKEAERWSIEHTGVGLSETELELVKFLEEKFSFTNSDEICSNNQCDYCDEKVKKYPDCCGRWIKVIL